MSITVAHVVEMDGHLRHVPDLPIEDWALHDVLSLHHHLEFNENVDLVQDEAEGADEE